MDLEVKPDDWILPNRIGYNRFVYDTFHPSKYSSSSKKMTCDCKKDECDVSSKSLKLFPQQRIIRDYMQIDSPYRGVLLYHELGSGKSAASIAAAEGYIERKDVYIFTPASLAQNYENELLKISKLGLNMKKSWTQLKTKNKKAVLDKYAISGNFVKNDLIWIPMYNNDIKDSLIVRENVKYGSLSSNEKNDIDNIIQNIIKNRYQFISYNGLTQKNTAEYKEKGFDNSFIVIDEIHNFISRVVNGSKLARSIYNSLMNSKNVKLVLLSGTPIINNPYEIATLINLIKGPMNIYDIKLLKKSQEKTIDEIIAFLKQHNMYQYIDEISYNSLNKKISMTLLPDGFVRNKNKIIKKIWKKDDEDIVKEIITKFNEMRGFHVGVKFGLNTYHALPSSADEFNKYFIDTTDNDNPVIKNEDLFQRRILGALSYYKTSGTELFPTVLPNVIQYLDMTPHQLSLYTDVRDRERAIDDRNKKSKFTKATNVLDDKTSVYRAFSRMVCNFAFPENIKREFPQDIRNMMKNEMNMEDIDGEGKTDLIKTARMKYEKHLDKAIGEIEEGDYISIENLKQMYSPKYAKMMDDIQTSPGTVLVYSQFRTVEGLGIFSKCLNKQGYTQINLKKTDDGYVFEDESVLDKEYDHKRYVIFDNDRTKTNILMNLFNGSFELLPDSIKKQLIDRDQLYGKLVKIMMITQSGSEGISLKNVRRVLIMEYFWNSVRINQVIGRAVRTCSHETLPKEERNVQIFTYIVKFTKNQLANDFTLRTLDNAITTDEHILQIATKKENIINKFLDMLKAASLDCIINSVQNRPKENGYKCYNWAINVDPEDLTYTPNITDDSKIQKHRKLQILKKGKGSVVSKNGQKYVMMNDKLYDYFSYKNAGILLPV
jgi:hypothetical protein